MASGRKHGTRTAQPAVDGNGRDPVELPVDLREDEWLADVASRLNLTRSAEKVLRFISAQPDKASVITASGLAEAVGVTPGTIVRFAQSAGFRGWPDFQTHFRHRYLGTLTASGVDLALEVGDSAASAALSRDRRNLDALVSAVDIEQINAVAERLASSKTLVASSGSYVAVGEILVQNARFLGYDVALEARGASHLVGALLQLAPGDTFVAISFWRLTNQLVQATRWCSSKGIFTIAITDSVFSPLAREAKHVLTAPTESVAFFQSLTGPISLVYAILATLHDRDSENARAHLQTAQQLYEALDVLHRPSSGSPTKPKGG